MSQRTKCMHTACVISLSDAPPPPFILGHSCPLPDLPLQHSRRFKTSFKRTSPKEWWSGAAQRTSRLAASAPRPPAVPRRTGGGSMAGHRPGADPSGGTGGSHSGRAAEASEVEAREGSAESVRPRSAAAPRRPGACPSWSSSSCCLVSTGS